MALDPRRVKALFHSALDLPDPADRPAFLDRECGDDLELRRRLEELLAAHDRPASVLAQPLVADCGEANLPSSDPHRDAATMDRPAVATERRATALLCTGWPSSVLGSPPASDDGPRGSCGPRYEPPIA